MLQIVCVFFLQGNIRVFCRVRPLLGDEKLGLDEIQHISFNNDDPRMMELEKLADIDPNQVKFKGIQIWNCDKKG